MTILAQQIPPCALCHIVHEDIVSLKNEAGPLIHRAEEQWHQRDYWLCVDIKACNDRLLQEYRAALQEAAELGHQIRTAATVELRPGRKTKQVRS